MFTLVAWYELQAMNGYTKLAALADEHIRVSGDDIIVPTINNLAGVFVRSNSIVKARFTSPSLRRFTNLYVHPLRQQWQVDMEEESHFMDFFHRPITLDISEALNCEIDNAGVSEYGYGLAWFMDKIDPAPSGEFRTVRATGAITAVAATWTSGALTFTEDLPAGRYAIIGADCNGASLVAFRLIFPGYAWRPGTKGVGEVPYPGMKSFRMGNKGLWGEFEHELPPVLEIFCRSADSEQEIYLDLVQIRAGRRG